MLVRELRKNVYEVSLSDEEVMHFRVILLNVPRTNVCTLSDLFNVLLTTIEQMWYKAVKEPNLDDFTTFY